jgi:hypothetical protein
MGPEEQRRKPAQRYMELKVQRKPAEGRMKRLAEGHMKPKEHQKLVALKRAGV